MCTFVMSFEDPLSVAPRSTKSLVGADCSDALNTPDEGNEDKDETLPLEQESEEKTPAQLYIEDTQSTLETNLEEQNAHYINANSWFVA
ncbi:hypothetical protein GDO78_008401 [Eleutherodactylus coqui]|uniref:Uncharacterized protein n=1 Tax=Eleutherodactylus coqui TaxID=57060 RepID=A0A8J6FD82_ELECQ|nr:hypothetical protein GDO78_008401 [Eleutherodactylus coqui]